MSFNEKIYQKSYYEQNKKYIYEQKKLYNKFNPWKKAFGHLKDRCNNPNDISYPFYGLRDIQCLITEEEIRTIMIRDHYWDMQVPSIDRIENDGNYIFENCRCVEKGLNIAERNKRLAKIVQQFDLEGNLLKEWNGLGNIFRALHYFPPRISSCCRGKHKTSYGFIWKYKERKVK